MLEMSRAPAFRSTQKSNCSCLNDGPFEKFHNKLSITFE